MKGLLIARRQGQVLDKQYNQYTQFQYISQYFAETGSASSAFTELRVKAARGAGA